MQERKDLSDSQINRDLLWPVLSTPLWFWGLLLGLGGVVAVAGGAVGWWMNRGPGVAGINRPIMWELLIITFVFWVGISHAGVMLSAILRLTQAEWRRPMVRAAEVLTVFSLATAAMFPLFHSGRPWRTMYWVFPYDFSRGIWPNVRSPLVWDPSAIFTYLTGSALFVLITLLPDLAVLRDRTTGIPHKIYSILSLGWRGTPRQWKLQTLAGILLSALILPVFVSVHSIVSWDFGMAISVEGWHTTVFAPYFVIGAVHSGVAAVVTMMAVMRWLFRWEDYIRAEHFDAIGRLLIVVALAWFFFFALEFIFSLYLREPQEVAMRQLQVFEWPFNMLFILFILTAFFIPVPLWLFRKVRRNVALMFWTSILVNIGMWLERFLIIVPGLARKQAFTFDWSAYRPSPIEMLIVIGSFALVCLGLLVFSKIFPLVPVNEAKEGQVLKADIQVGKRKVPAIVREH
ncbi:MAG: polysulfide reductase NrfD [Dehalococcoidia bacterium]|nr:polysulfide reductase NrfD [Dehalococcoidia bacterium]MDW8119988.1 NrfD/PsrC family molybdoenzyme membrane anchor subunit [Chloroflexota bacterium]